MTGYQSKRAMAQGKSMTKYEEQIRGMAERNKGSVSFDGFQEALAQPEPVAWPCLIDTADFSKNTITIVMQCEDYKVSAGTHYLSTTPRARTWVGLKPEEILDLFDEHNVYGSKWIEFARAVEAKLKEKNT